MRCQGREKGGEKIGGLMIRIYNVGWGVAQGELCNTEKTRSDSTASYLLRCCTVTVIGLWGGVLGEGGSLVNIMFFM